ncbi:hypothetical protein GGR53DRAFT_356179 [Hypoxylon sp. FL1150]|nr:hypothetical protein GGR53DRAFT_356179 [Hypoxylon sp. FL1150]
MSHVFYLYMNYQDHLKYHRCSKSHIKHSKTVIRHSKFVKYQQPPNHVFFSAATPRRHPLTRWPRLRSPSASTPTRPSNTRMELILQESPADYPGQPHACIHLREDEAGRPGPFVLVDEVAVSKGAVSNLPRHIRVRLAP